MGGRGRLLERKKTGPNFRKTNQGSYPKVIKLSSCSALFMLSWAQHGFYHAHKCQNAEIVAILIFIIMVNTTSDNLKASKVIIFSVLWAVEILCSIDLSIKNFYNLGPGRILPTIYKKTW